MIRYLKRALIFVNNTNFLIALKSIIGTRKRAHFGVIISSENGVFGDEGVRIGTGV